MKETFVAQKITDTVYWVGAVDWNIRDFHGYATHRGTTYNAYLVLADKVTLIDTVKAPFKNQLMARIASVISPDKIDYIVSNHSEMDHSGCLTSVMAEVNPEKVFASTMGVKALKAHLGPDLNVTPVKDGETLSLGNRTLTFLETRMLHWPDSMLSYIAEEKLLFSQDGFGMHLASSERFADEIPNWLLEYEGAKYFANILMPFAPIAQKVLARVAEMNLPIRIIAPDHGPIWRKNPEEIVTLYGKWAAQKPTKKAVVTYDTMWNSTEAMAHSLGDGLVSEGLSVKLMSLKGSHRSDVATELLDAGALVVGSPTMNNNLFPTVADLLTYLRGLRPRNLVGAAFGSYGWSGEAVAQVNEYLKAIGVTMVSEGIKAQYVPGADCLAECRELGVTVGKTLKEQFEL